ncbi:MAG: folate-binding protein YgfZ [Anaerolineales bacterium]|nr:folate-binding protein YgfZ [Anaerolineales bacterium]
MSEVYAQAREGSVYYLVQSAGCLQISGADRIDFLHRQSTNDLRNLVAGQVRTTVLTSPTARILDVLHVYPVDEHLQIIPLPGRAAQTAAYLKDKIFFNDKVELVDVSAEYTHIDVLGPASQQALGEVGFEALPEVGSQRQGEIAGVRGDVLKLEALAAPSAYRLVVPSERVSEVIAQLDAAGMMALDAETAETLRVEAGIPGPENELTDEYTPLEAGLAAAISDNKGCYTGQEIIARQITYDKITRSLVRLRFTESVEVGAKVFGEGKQVGAVTSMAQSPDQGALALAIIKRPYNTTGREVQIAGDGKEVQANVEEIA